MTSNTWQAISTRYALALALFAGLAACSGGGGSTSGTTAPPAAALPTISAQPQNITASVGSSVSFSVTAAGAAPLSYQWQRNGADVAGATAANYVLASAQFSDSGSKWSVVVRDSMGSTVSAQATLTVTGTSLLAGSMLPTDFINGQLIGITVDNSGNAYLLDRTLETGLYKFNPQGVKTLLQLHTQDNDAALLQPSGLGSDAAGNFYLADQKCSIRKITPDGLITVLAGSAYACGHADGKGAAATFSAGAHALVADAANNVFVGDRQYSTIRKITSDGVVTTVAGTAGAFGTVDGIGSAARFGEIVSMVIDGAGNLYVTDAGVTGTGPSVRKITPAGVVTTLAGGTGYGSADGQHAAASFRALYGIAIDAAGNLYAADQGNHTIRKITQGGMVTTFAGQSTTENPPDTNPTDGPAALATFRQPVAMRADNAGNIFVIEASPGLGFNALRKIDDNGVVSTITGTLAGRGAADGQGAAATFTAPRGLAVDAVGTVWVADTGNQLIRRISASGTVSTLAGATGMASFNDPGDGKGSQARFFQPSAIVVDDHGTAYVADDVHHTIRKVLSDGTVTTLAGNTRSYGAVDGIGTAANFSTTTGIAIDRSGILYVTDSSAIRRVDPGSGAVTTLAGKLGPIQQGSADGVGSAASFAYMPAIAADNAGNLYVVDSLNNNVRKITPGGVVTTLAGNAGVTGFADGQGTAASFNHPQGIAVDAAGSVYVADTDNDLIRRITPAGMVTTIAGQPGANGNATGALNGPLSRPIGLAFDANGILYVCASNGIFQLHL